jgi:hypothetical protein
LFSNTGSAAVGKTLTLLKEDKTPLAVDLSLKSHLSTIAKDLLG